MTFQGSDVMHSTLIASKDRQINTRQNCEAFFDDLKVCDRMLHFTCAYSSPAAGCAASHAAVPRMVFGCCVFTHAAFTCANLPGLACQGVYIVIPTSFNQLGEGAARREYVCLFHSTAPLLVRSLPWGVSYGLPVVVACTVPWLPVRVCGRDSYECLSR